jgi:uncharacterized membrane protein
MADDESVEDEAQDQPRQVRTARLEAFSDGVFAIAITLLVLEISVPAGSDDDLLNALLDQWPSYLAYVVSFATIGAIWLVHTVVTEYLGSADAMLVRLNLLLLMLVSFIPFPTRLLAEYHGGDAGRVSTTIYGLNLLLTAVVVSGLWRYAVHQQLLRPDTSDKDVQTITTKLTPGMAGYVALIALGAVLPTVAVIGYLAIALYILVPFTLMRRRTPR